MHETRVSSLGSASYHRDWAGYTASGRWFRFVSTTLTVPARTLPSATSGAAAIMLNQARPTGLPTAEMMVEPGGGPGSVIASADPGGSQTLRISPKVGDQLRVSIFYDQNGHYAVTDTTQAATQTVTTAAPYASSMPLNSAVVAAMFDNSAVTPPTDTQVWQFTDSKVTTYGGDHGSILGPWATSR